MFTLLVYDAGMAIGVNVRAAEQFSSNPPATFERRARIELFFYYSPVEQDESLDAFAGQLASVIAAYRGGTHRARGGQGAGRRHSTPAGRHPFPGPRLTSLFGGWALRSRMCRLTAAVLGSARHHRRHGPTYTEGTP